MTNYDRETLVQLRESLVRYFNLEELRTLCSDLDIDYENFPQNKAGMARELVALCERSERIPHLIKRYRELRPRVRWTTSVSSSRPQLEKPPHDFKGRAREIALLESALQPGSTVIVSGMGGVGKTALAYCIADRLTERFPHGQIKVNMRGTSNHPMQPIEAMRSIVHQLRPDEDISSDNLDTAREEYLGLLRSRRALILLDDAANARQISPLLGLEKCALLITSRRKMSLSVDQVLKLDTLPPGPACELLESIMQDRQATTDQLKRIAELCGYLPLALRIAGSFLSLHDTWQLDEYADKLSDERERLEFLQVEHQEVRATLGMSYVQLSSENADGAARWLKLAVLPGPFDRAAAAAVWGIPDERHSDVHMLLSELAARNLLLYTPPPSAAGTVRQGQYHLHDLLRLFALEQADMRPVVLDTLRSLMRNRELSPMERRTAALWLTHLRWLPEVPVNPREMLTYLDVVIRYVDSAPDLNYLAQRITAMLDSPPADMSHHQQARLLVTRAVALGQLDKQDQAKCDYERAEQLLGEPASSQDDPVEDERALARVYLGVGNLAFDRDADLSPRVKKRRQSLHEALEWYLKAAEFAVRANQLALVHNKSDDATLEAGIYEEISSTYNLLAEEGKAAEYFERASKVLEVCPQQDDPEAYAGHYARVLDLESYEHLNRGQNLATRRKSAQALEEFEQAYRSAWKEILLVRKHLDTGASPLLVQAHIHTGDSLWRMSKLRNVRRRQPVVKARVHWQRALDMAVHLGILDAAKKTSVLFKDYCKS